MKKQAGENRLIDETLKMAYAEGNKWRIIMKIIKNAQVYAPAPLGKKDILIEG